MTELSIIYIVLGLQFKHFLADYVLQNQYIIVNRQNPLHPAGYIHSGIHVVLTTLLLSLFKLNWSAIAVIAICEFVFHFAIDIVKDNWIRFYMLKPSSAQFWWVQGFDQFLHQVSYALIIVFVSTVHEVMNQEIDRPMISPISVKIKLERHQSQALQCNLKLTYQLDRPVGSGQDVHRTSFCNSNIGREYIDQCRFWQSNSSRHDT